MKPTYLWEKEERQAREGHKGIKKKKIIILFVTSARWMPREHKSLAHLITNSSPS